MHIESFREYCLSMSGADESLPFDENTLCFKVKGKIFAICDIMDFESINLKCDPEKAIQLREEFEGVEPGYHMNKKHWNTVMMDHSIPDNLVREWTRESYELVVIGLPKKDREALRGD